MPSATNVQDLDMPYFDFADPVVAKNPQAEARRLGLENWIARTPQGYALLRWEDCKEIDRDKRFRTPPGQGIGSQGITEGVAFEWASSVVVGLDGADHERIRQIAAPCFTPGGLETLRPSARELFAEILDESLPAGRSEAADLCMSYSVRMICRLLGWPEEDWRRILAWSHMAVGVASVSVSPEQLKLIENALLELREYTTAQLSKLRGNVDSSFATALLGAEEEGQLTTKELLDLFETLLVAGSDTTKAALTWAMLLFAKYPEQWDAVTADPSLVPSAVEEVLRFRSPTLATGRVAREDVVYKDVVFPAGVVVYGFHTSANFDSDFYAEPLGFDVRRYADGRRVPKPNHLTFGFGVHVCLGNFLARLELQEALSLLADRVRAFRIDESDPRGVEWGSPFGVHGPARLPLEWDLVPSA